MVFILENLPNEILLFIFKYLSTIDILCTFYRLNRRFSSIIRTIQHLHLDFSSHCLSKIQFIHILNHARSLNIESITISTRYYVDMIPLLVSYLPPSQLNHLHSLTLIDVDRTSIEKLLHHQLKLTSLSLESSSWRSIPRHSLPYYPNLIRCRLPILDLLHHCHTQLIDLTLTNCTAENLIQLNILVPNLQSLTLTLTNHVNIPPMVQFPMQLISLRLILKSVLFTEFERLILMLDQLDNLTISFNNTEHDVHCFDQYLLGENWLVIANQVHHLQFNIIVHRTFEIYAISELHSNFHWFNQRLICQTIEHTNGYHLFTLPLIDSIYTIYSLHTQAVENNDFISVDHLYLIIPNESVQCSFNRFSNDLFPNLQILTIIVPYIDNLLVSFIDHLSQQSRCRTLELRLTSMDKKSGDLFGKLISRLPTAIETLILNTISTRIFSEILDENHQLLSNLKRLLCSVKNRDEFDALILLLLEVFSDKSLIFLNISSENAVKSCNLLSGWLLKTNSLKKARIKSSDRQCSIWL